MAPRCAALPSGRDHHGAPDNVGMTRHAPAGPGPHLLDISPGQITWTWMALADAPTAEVPARLLLGFIRDRDTAWRASGGHLPQTADTAGPGLTDPPEAWPWQVCPSFTSQTPAPWRRTRSELGTRVPPAQHPGTYFPPSSEASVSGLLLQPPLPGLHFQNPPGAELASRPLSSVGSLWGVPTWPGGQAREGHSLSPWKEVLVGCPVAWRSS